MSKTGAPGDAGKTPDFLLNVGIDIDSSFENMKRDINNLIDRLNNSPDKHKIKLSFDTASTSSAVKELKTETNKVIQELEKQKASLFKMTGGLSGYNAKKIKTDLGGIPGLSKEAISALTTQLQTADVYISKINANWMKIGKNKSRVLQLDVMGEDANGKMLKYVIQYNRETGQITKELGAIGQKYKTIQQINREISREQKRQAAEKAREERKALALAKEREREKQALSRRETAAYQRALTLSKRLHDAERNWTGANKGLTSGAYQAILRDKEAIDLLIRQYSTGKAKGQNFIDTVNALSASFSKNAGFIKDNNRNVLSFGDNFAKITKKFGTWFTISSLFMKAYRELKRMISTVVELDTAMTELKKVTDETDARYERFFDNASSRAKELGATVKDTITATADFARLGFNIDDAEKLADVAIVYKNVGDGINSISDASESIISTMQAFNVAPDEAMSIVDKFNIIGNKFAISSKGVGEALLRSAASMKSANNTLDETIALAAAANTVVQDPQKVGTVLKTLPMFLRAAKTELEAAGESSEGMASSVSKLRKELLSLTGGKVDIQIDSQTFKSTYQILKELSQVWDKISDVSQANILQKIGGKRNANVVAAILENFSVAERALAVSSNSAGSALAENEKYLNSIEGRISKFKATAEEFSAEFINSGIVKNVVDLGTGLMKVFTWLDKINVLIPSIATSVAAIVAMKKGIAATNMQNQVKFLAGDIITGSIGKDTKKVAVSEAFKLSVQALNKEQKELLLTEIKRIAVEDKLTKEQLEAIISQTGLSAANATLTATNKGLAASFKAVTASMPVWGKIAIVAGIVVDVVVGLTSAFGVFEDRVQSSEEKISSLKEEFNGMAGEAKSAAESFKAASNAVEDIAPKFKELLSGVDKFGNNVSLSDGEYKEFISLNNQLAELFPSINLGLDSNGNSMLSLAYDANILNDSLKELVKTRRQEALTNITDDLPDVAENISKRIKVVEKQKNQIKRDWQDMQTLLRAIPGETSLGRREFDLSGAFEGQKDQLKKYFDKFGINYDIGSRFSVNLGIFGGDISGETIGVNDIEAQLKKAEFNRQKLINDLNNQQNDTKGEIRSYIAAWLQIQPEFEEMSIEVQNAMLSIVSSFDLSNFNFENPTESLNDFSNNYLAKMYAIKDEAGAFFKEMNSLKAKLYSGEITDAQYEEKIRALSNAVDKNKDVFIEALRGMGYEGEALDDIVSNVISNTETSMDRLRVAVEGASGAFSKIAEAKSEYDAAMSIPEKDTGFKSMAEAFKQLNEEFVNGTVNSNAFWAASKFLFGEKKLDEWGWGDGIANIRQAMKDSLPIFKDAESAGKGFIKRMYGLAQNGQVLGEDGGIIAEIKQLASGAYDFKIDYENIDQLADKMNLSEEAILACLKAVSMFGNVSFYDIEDVALAMEKVGLSAVFAGTKVVDLEALKETLRGFGQSENDINKIIDDLEELGGLTFVDVNADASALKEQLEDLGVITQNNINVESLQGLITALNLTKDEADKAVTKLGSLEGIKFTDTEGNIKTVDEVLKGITGADFNPVEKAMDDVVEATGKLEGLLGDILQKLKDLTTGKYSITIDLFGSAGNFLKDVFNSFFPGEKPSEDSSSGTMKTNAKGTKHARKGNSLVGEKGEELVLSGDEAYFVGTDHPEIVSLSEGDTVYTAEETRRIKNGGYRRHLNAFSGGFYGGVRFDDYDDLLPDKNGRDSSTSSRNGKAESEFERLYKYHKHLVAMDIEETKDFLQWLDKAYKAAYKAGEIELDDYRKYREEVYKGTQNLFKDRLSDIDHEVSTIENNFGSSGTVINIISGAIEEIENELSNAYEYGLDENDEYVQWLESQWLNYNKKIKELREDAAKDAESTTDKLVKYRIDMLKKQLELEKESLKKRLDSIKEFYGDQKKLLKDQRDEEKYTEEQQEKRKSVADIKMELARLENDNSAWASKRKLELREDLQKSEKDLSNFEKDHALDTTIDFLDQEQKKQEKFIEGQIEEIDKKLNDPEALFNKALADIKGNTLSLYNEFIAFNRKYGTGNDKDIEDMWEEAYIADQKNIAANGFTSADARKALRISVGLDKATADELVRLDVDKDGRITSADASSIQKTSVSNQGTIGNYTGYVPPKDVTPPREVKQGDTPSASPKNEASSQAKPNAPSLSKGSLVKIKDSASQFGSKSGGIRMASFVPGSTFSVYGVDGNQILIGLNGVYTGWVNKSDIVGYKNGTEYATAGLHRIDEVGSEYLFSSKDGNNYRVLNSGDKVLNAKSSKFLYEFATQGSKLFDGIFSRLFSSTSFGKITAPVVANQIEMGDIIIEGNTNDRTVSEIRRAQRQGLEDMLRGINDLNKK